MVALFSNVHLDSFLSSIESKWDNINSHCSITKSICLNKIKFLFWIKFISLLIKSSINKLSESSVRNYLSNFSCICHRWPVRMGYLSNTIERFIKKICRWYYFGFTQRPCSRNCWFLQPVSTHLVHDRDWKHLW